jgi:hypothetical protein
LVGSVEGSAVGTAVGSVVGTAVGSVVGSRMIVVVALNFSDRLVWVWPLERVFSIYDQSITRLKLIRTRTINGSKIKMVCNVFVQ